MQHEYGPGTTQANEFYMRVDEILGQFLELDVRVGITADHGMNDKTNLIFVQDILNKMKVKSSVNRSIKDPYMAHHNGYGSFVQVFLEDNANRREIVKYLNSIKGTTVKRYNGDLNGVYKDTKY